MWRSKLCGCERPLVDRSPPKEILVYCLKGAKRATPFIHQKKNSDPSLVMSTSGERSSLLGKGIKVPWDDATTVALVLSGTLQLFDEERCHWQYGSPHRRFCRLCTITISRYIVCSWGWICICWLSPNAGACFVGLGCYELHL